MKPIKRTKDKVLILGTIKTWKEAPLDDSTWEVWGMNQFWDWWGQYATRWFEIHPVSVMVYEGWKKYNWLTKCPIPVYMKKHYVNIPSSIPYPINDVSKGLMKIFSSTFCYQLALAIHENFKTIGIYGVDFSRDSLRERFIEWRGILYWIGVATGRGIKIQFPDKGENALGHHYLYGLDYWHEVDDVRQQVLKPFYSIVARSIDGASWGSRNKSKELR